MVGEMKSKHRERVSRQFSEDPRYNILVASMQITMLGHNLSVANQIFSMDAWYNPQCTRQGIYRVERPGQVRYTRLVVFVPRGTAVEHAFLINHEKMRIEEMLIGGKRASRRGALSRPVALKILPYADAYEANILHRIVRL